MGRGNVVAGFGLAGDYQFDHPSRFGQLRVGVLQCGGGGFGCIGGEDDFDGVFVGPIAGGLGQTDPPYHG